MRQKYDLLDALEKANLKGRSILGMDAFRTRDELQGLLDVAAFLEPYARTGGLNIIPSKVMASIFFEPSTRTRLGFESAMQKLGGSVISEATPMITSRVASGESIEDTLRTVSKYVHIIGMRHREAAVEAAVKAGAEVPVITGGFGGKEHPVQCIVDVYTMWRNLGKIEGLNVLIPGPELITSRVAHSQAYGLAMFNANIIFATEKDGRVPEDVMERLRGLNANVKEVIDPTGQELEDLMSQCDVLSMPAWVRGVPKEEPAKSEFLELAKKYYVGMGPLKKAKEAGRTVYVLHPLPRLDVEMDFEIDKTENSLIWDQVELSINTRMAMILCILYGT